MSIASKEAESCVLVTLAVGLAAARSGVAKNDPAARVWGLL
jgi:hypothetical protein